VFFEKKQELFVGRFPAWCGTSALRHGFSTRRGGISRPPFGTLNLGLNTADDSASIHENLARFCRAGGWDRERMAFTRQVHGDRIEAVTSPGVHPDTDALITDSAEVILVIQVADCVPVFLYDPVRRAVGLVHAGWRGTALEIAGKTVRAMSERFGSKPADLSACIGPSIGPCCCEVGDDVAERFPAEYLSHGHLDLWRCNRDSLIRSGMAADSVHLSRLCSACHKDWFFSYRGDGGETGRMMGVIGLGKSS
jgi:polyphenol oxidase